MRSIKQIVKAQRVNMGGIFLDQPLPYYGINQIDPFLLIHHWKEEMPGGQKQQNVGVGPHPHRGFAPVTFIFEGNVHHRDSLGTESIVLGGGTQWMNSGRGIVHSERPSKELAETGGRFEIIQFWVNAPAKNKMDEPDYQPLSKEETPIVCSDDGKVKVGVVAGDFQGTTSSIDTYSPMLILRLEVEQDGEMSIPIPENYNALLYLLDGSLEVNQQQEANEKDMLWFNNDSTGIHVKGKAATRAIVLAGEPIGESLATRGPFVMNTQREIVEAIRDYQAGKMGRLVEVFE